MAGLFAVAGMTAAVVVHAMAAPVIFTAVSRKYFQPIGARAPLVVALAFVALTALFQLVFVAGLVHGNLDVFESVPATWIPLGSILIVTWITGTVLPMRPVAARAIQAS